MTVYTIKTVNGEPKEWQSNYGPMVTYKLDLEDEGGLSEVGVELNRKPESRAPREGERVAGHLEEGNYGTKLKIDFEATKELNQGGGQEASAGTSTAWTNSRPTRDLDASIARQVALKVLSRSICEEGFDKVRAEVEQVEKFILEGGQAAKEGPGSASVGGDSPPAEGPASESAPPLLSAIPSLQEIGELLARYGLSYAPARDKVAGHIGFKLLAEGRAEKALAGLENDESRERVLAKLKDECAPLPEPLTSDLTPPDSSGLGATDPDDTIPF